MNENLQLFQNQSFLNLETFYPNGRGVKTPVWFVQDGEKLYVRTVANSWKVKRARKNPAIKIVPCKSQGQPLGEWVDGRAKVINDPNRAAEINQLLNKKYGIQKRAFDLLGKLRKDQMGVLEIEVSPDPV
jgi:PPOX class probable F420-dependent enzyme